MSKALVAHVALLVLGLTCAAWMWRAPTTSAGEGKVTLLDHALADVERIELRGADSVVELTSYPDGEDLAWAVKLVRSVAERPAPGPRDDVADAGVAGAADGGAEPAAGGPEAKKEPKTFVFPAGSSVVRSVEKLAPFIVDRSLSDVPQERLATMGLDDPKEELVIVARGKTWRYQVGGKTYGGRGYYLRGEDGVVHLAPGDALRGLEGTETKLAERRLVTLPLEDIAAASFERKGRKGRFVHTDRDQPKKRFFALEGSPEEKNDEASGAVGALRRMRSTRYLVPEEASPGDRPLALAFVLERADGGRVEGRIYEPQGGQALVVVDRWTAEVSEGQAKAVLDDVDAALP